MPRTVPHTPHATKHIELYSQSGPLRPQVIVCLSAGLLCDTLINRCGLPSQHVQARFQLIATVLPTLSLLGLAFLEESPGAAGVLATIWLGCTSFHCAGAVAVLHAVGQARAGELFVLGNAFAKLGALASTSATRWALHAFGWRFVLISVAVGYALSGAALIPRMKRVDAAAAFVAGGKDKSEKRE
jgi:hypothetical protein